MIFRLQAPPRSMFRIGKPNYMLGVAACCATELERRRSR